MNALQFDALIFELAVERDLVAGDVKMQLRNMARDDESLTEFIKPQKQRLANGQVVNIDFESQIDSLREQYEKAKPVQRQLMRLKARESQLRGDLYELLLGLEGIPEPGDIRDLVRYAEGLMQNPQPGAIREALDLYRDHRGNASDAVAHELYKKLNAEFEALYPPDEE
jgi:hypothetical protein